MKRILIFISYFGAWPPWIDIFLASCEANETVNWCIHTDCAPLDYIPANVEIVQVSFQDYCRLVSERLEIRFAPRSAYNICNLKPALGYVHSDKCAGYDIFGFGDLDVIYGDLRAIYDDAVLDADVISSHGHICSGHLLLTRNTDALQRAFFHAHEWKDILEDDGPVEWDRSLDEARLSILFMPCDEVRAGFMRRFNAPRPDPAFHSNTYFREQWSTPFVPGPWKDNKDLHPETWFWRGGALTNCEDQTGHLYLHLMNFRSERWVAPRYKGAMTWEAAGVCLHFDVKDFLDLPPSRRALRIDRSGIHLDLV